MIGRVVVDRLFAAVLLVLSAAVTTAARAETSICGGTRIPIDTSVFGKPFVKLTFSRGNNGNFLLDTGTTHSRVDMRAIWCIGRHEDFPIRVLSTVGARWSIHCG